MNELITASLEAKDLTHLIDFPDFLMSDFEKEVCNWILSYAKDYGMPPAVSRLRKQFTSFVPIKSDETMPLADVAEMELAQKRAEYAANVLGESIETIRESGDIPLDKIGVMLRQLSSTSSTLAKYTTFDRRSYFRDGVSMPFGLRLIDSATGGLYPGEFALVVGRLGTGKSTICQFIMANLFKASKRILLISKEMLPLDVFARIDAIEGHFNPMRLRSAKYEEMAGTLSVIRGIIGHSGGEIFAPVKSTYSPAQIAAQAQHLNVDVIVVDGAYLLQPSDRAKAQTWENVATVSRELKDMALDVKVPVIGTSQLKRLGGREFITAEDIAYSDALGQDTDFIISIRPLHIPGKNRSELTLVKNRPGKGEITTIVDIDFELMQLRDISVEGE